MLGTIIRIEYTVQTACQSLCNDRTAIERWGGACERREGGEEGVEREGWRVQEKRGTREG